MEYQNYFPVYHSNYDLNSDANGGAKPIHYGNDTFQSGHCSKYVLPLPVRLGPLELVRQTILMHEATFKDQVQELHRLYRRQKELMCEIRSQQLYMNHFHLEGHSPKSFLNYSYGVQNTLYSLPFVNSNLGSGNIGTLPRSFKDHRISSISFMSQSDGNSNNHLHIESKVRKIGGKFLDLELPAEVYVDNEEGESIEDSKYPEPHMPSTLLSSGKPSCALQGMSPSSCPKLNTTLTDLNEATLISSLKKNGSIVQALPCLVNQLSSSKGAKIVSTIKGHVDHKLDASSTYESLKDSSSKSNCKDSMVSLLSVTSDVVINQDAMTSKSNLAEVVLLCETTRRSKKCRLIDINIPYDPASEEEPVIEAEHMNSAHINLNLPLNEEGSPQKSSLSERNALEIDLKAPPSPEVEECPPPRGDSEENLLEGGDPFEELVKNAADAIVSISSIPSSKTQPFPDLTLEWFAGLIPSISRQLEKENGFRALSYTDTDKLDEFEAMTLELTEMKEEEYWSKSKKLTCSIPVCTQMRKGRTRRSKQKDFQKEVLPSLASLSRYEVTEDMQMIEGLMEASGTPFRMRRQTRAAKKSNFEVPEFHGGPLMCWGWANRRSRGKRSRASHFMVLTRWLEFSA